MEICGECSLFNSECLDKNCLALDFLFIHFRESEEINNYLKENFNISIENNFVVGSEKKIRKHLKEQLQEIQIEIDKIDDLIYREMIHYLNRTTTIEECTNSLNRLQKYILARKHYLEQYKILKDSLNNFR